MRRALFCDHACHVKSGQKCRKYHSKYLIHSHSNEEPSVILSQCFFFFSQQRLSLLIDASDRDFLNSTESQFQANVPHSFFFPQLHFITIVLRKTTLSLFTSFFPVINLPRICMQLYRFDLKLFKVILSMERENILLYEILLPLKICMPYKSAVLWDCFGFILSFFSFLCPNCFVLLPNFTKQQTRTSVEKWADVLNWQFS